MYMHVSVSTCMYLYAHVCICMCGMCVCVFVRTSVSVSLRCYPVTESALIGQQSHHSPGPLVTYTRYFQNTSTREKTRYPTWKLSTDHIQHIFEEIMEQRASVTCGKPEPFLQHRRDHNDVSPPSHPVQLRQSKESGKKDRITSCCPLNMP